MNFLSLEKYFVKITYNVTCSTYVHALILRNSCGKNGVSKFMQFLQCAFKLSWQKFRESKVFSMGVSF